MTIAGWIFMLASCGCVITLAAYCYYRVFTTPAPGEHIHAPLEIDTHDADT